MPTARWNGVVLAESDATVVVEGNHYFPPESLNMEYFSDSKTTTRCPWKGIAEYYSLLRNHFDYLWNGTNPFVPSHTLEQIAESVQVQV